MGYYNGTANDMTAVRTALVNACTLEGWAWNSSTEMLSKGAMFLRLQVVSGCLTLLGRTSAAAGDMPSVVRIAPFASSPVTFPLTYEIFVLPDEVYMVVNYSVDRYQWCAFGQSTVQGLLGSGMWVGASANSATVSVASIGIGPAYGSSYYGCCPALFYDIQDGSSSGCFVHSGLDAQGWWWSQTLNGTPVGITPAIPLIGLLPNAWNSEAVLLPIRAYKIRPSAKISLTADLGHARYTRIDNYSPGEIISIGSDRWKIYPWYRKDSSARNGGNAINHTGTFGWAIRYEGP